MCSGTTRGISAHLQLHVRSSQMLMPRCIHVHAKLHVCSRKAAHLYRKKVRRTLFLRAAEVRQVWRSSGRGERSLPHRTADTNAALSSTHRTISTSGSKTANSRRRDLSHRLTYDFSEWPHYLGEFAYGQSK